MTPNANAKSPSWKTMRAVRNCGILVRSSTSSNIGVTGLGVGGRGTPSPKILFGSCWTVSTSSCIVSLFACLTGKFKFAFIRFDILGGRVFLIVRLFCVVLRTTLPLFHPLWWVLGHLLRSVVQGLVVLVGFLACYSL